MNTTWFNNLPLFDEDKSLVLVFDLINSEVVPAEKKKHLYYPKLLTATSQFITLLKHET